MAATYTPIATTTLGTDTTTVTFNSISGYTDLKLIVVTKNNNGPNINTFIRFNSDTGSNYSDTYLDGTGSSAVSGRDTNSTYTRLGYSNDTNPSVFVVDIMNYANSTTYKSYLSRGNDASSSVWAIVGLWRNTAAITSITLYNELSAKFVSGATFTLYGILSA